MKRISFNEWDAYHLYELAAEHFQEKCFGCDTIKKRLEKFLGPKQIKEIRKVLKKNGYCSKLKNSRPKSFPTVEK